MNKKKNLESLTTDNTETKKDHGSLTDSGFAKYKSRGFKCSFKKVKTPHIPRSNMFQVSDVKATAWFSVFAAKTSFFSAIKE